MRWLDENGDMLPTDTRGDQVADVMQIDKNGDDKLASASASGERYDHGYRLKGKIFREIRARLRQTQQNQLEKDLIRLCYTGQFEEYGRLIVQVPGN